MFVINNEQAAQIINELTAKVDALENNLKHQQSQSVSMTQRYELYDLALKFAAALASSSTAIDPITEGFDLAEQYLDEIKSREKRQ